MMKSTLDSIFKVGFGIDLNTLSGSDELGSRFSKAFDDSNYIVFRRYADIFWEVKRYFKIGLEAKLRKNIQVIDDYVFQLIRHKRELMKSETGDVSISKPRRNYFDSNVRIKHVILSCRVGRKTYCPGLL